MKELEVRKLIQDKIPIESDRLVIRRFILNDMFKFWNYVSDRSLYKYLVCSKFASRDQSDVFIMNIMSAYKESEITRFAIADRENNELVGGISAYIKNYDVELGNYEIELGYWVGKEFRGMGYMSETLNAMINSLTGMAGVRSVITDIIKENKASIYLVEKLGFICKGTFTVTDSSNKKRKAVRYVLDLGGN